MDAARTLVLLTFILWRMGTLMAAMAADGSDLQSDEVSTKIMLICYPVLLLSSICGHESGMVSFPPRSTAGGGTSRIGVTTDNAEQAAAAGRQHHVDALARDGCRGSDAHPPGARHGPRRVVLLPGPQAAPRRGTPRRRAGPHGVWHRLAAAPRYAHPRGPHATAARRAPGVTAATIWPFQSAGGVRYFPIWGTPLVTRWGPAPVLWDQKRQAVSHAWPLGGQRCMLRWDATGQRGLREGGCGVPADPIMWTTTGHGEILAGHHDRAPSTHSSPSQRVVSPSGACVFNALRIPLAGRIVILCVSIDATVSSSGCRIFM